MAQEPTGICSSKEPKELTLKRLDDINFYNSDEVICVHFYRMER